MNFRPVCCILWLPLLMQSKKAATIRLFVENSTMGLRFVEMKRTMKG
jgi:hypothetical protein